MSTPTRSLRIISLAILPFLLGFTITGKGLLNYPFVYDCITYSDDNLGDELNKQGFSLIYDWRGGNGVIPRRFYSNQIEEPTPEIGVTRTFTGENYDVRMIIISFSHKDSTYVENYSAIEKEIIANNTFEKEFYSIRTKTMVKKYRGKNGAFFYLFEDIDYPCIAISRQRIDEIYFSWTYQK